jgi:heat-inducible transcriptional repressor
MQEASMIVCRYKLGRDYIGAIGVIGPTRMDYSKIVSRLEYFAGNLNKLLTDNL